MPAARSTFTPRRFLGTGHLQTLAGNYLPRPHTLPPPEARLFQVEPDVQVLCHCHWQPERWRDFIREWIREHQVPGALALLATGPSAYHPDDNHRLEVVRL